jgi:hypothetical protein
MTQAMPVYWVVGRDKEGNRSEEMREERRQDS